MSKRRERCDQTQAGLQCERPRDHLGEHVAETSVRVIRWSTAGVPDGTDKRRHGLDAAGGGDVGGVPEGELLGPCPSCSADLHLSLARDPRTGRTGRVIVHPVPFCSYYGETDPATIERAVLRALKELPS